jgi:hypothetical protein
MPQISKTILDSTFYLYPTEEDAVNGTSMGGTGFLVAYTKMFTREMGSADIGRPNMHIYGVTNYHVAVRGSNSQGSPVVRLNCLDGTTERFPFDCADWEYVPGGSDVAVVRIPVDPKKHQIGAIPLSQFVSKEHLKWGRQVDTGEDVFMVGRFMDHDGGEVNLPAVRFGNISVLPTPIHLDEFGRDQDLYCIDLHSRSGFSGSPIFSYRTLGSDLSGHDITELLNKMGLPEIEWVKIDHFSIKA